MSFRSANTDPCGPRVSAFDMAARNSSQSHTTGNYEHNFAADDVAGLPIPQFVSHHNIGRRWIKLHPHLLKRDLSREFSVLSYNVLSDELLANHLFLYSGCQEWCLHWKYRRENLLKEILHLKPEIICLQEVQADHYSDWFLPSLSKHGYAGFFKKRSGEKLDGCALFVRTKVFQVVRFKGVEYSRDNMPSLSRDNVGVVALLKLKDDSNDRCVCIATTHLLFSPKRGDIKLIQIACLLAEMNEIASLPPDSILREREGLTHYPVVLCGDFNSLPRSPLYSFVASSFLCYDGLRRHEISAQESPRGKSNARLPKVLIPTGLRLTNDCVWINEHDATVTDNVAADQGISDGSNQKGDIQHHEASEDQCVLRHQFSLESVYRHEFQNGAQEITTHHGLTSCTVDYIFYSSLKSSDGRKPRGLVLTGLLCLTSSQSLQRFGPLPCPQMSSDHLPLLAAFKLR